MSKTTVCIQPSGRILHIVVVTDAAPAAPQPQVCRAVECTERLIHSWAARAFEHAVHEAGIRCPKGLLRAHAHRITQHALYVFRQTSDSKRVLEALYELLHDEGLMPALLAHSAEVRQRRAASKRARR
jgi:hypothetical protein